MKYFALLLFLYTYSISIVAQEDSSKIVNKVVPSMLHTEDQHPDWSQMLPSLNLHTGEYIINPEHTDFQIADLRMGENKSDKGFLRSVYPKLIVPGALIAYGVFAQENHVLKQLDSSTGNEVGEHISKSMPYDDYLQFAPSVAVYGLSWAGVKSKHNIKDRTVVMATSHLLMAAAVHTIKSTTNVVRPDGSARNSFPSGHTAAAFVGAHVLFREYFDTSPWIGVSGYLVSSTTGVMRVLNNKHWVSDVVTGAGIGILSVEVSYMLLPVMNKVLYPNRKKEGRASLSLAPEIGAKSMALDFVCIF